MKKIITAIAVLISLQTTAQRLELTLSQPKGQEVVRVVKDTLKITNCTNLNWIQINGVLFTITKSVSVEKYESPNKQGLFLNQIFPMYEGTTITPTTSQNLKF